MKVLYANRDLVHDLTAGFIAHSFASMCNVYFQNSVVKKQEDDSSGEVTPGYTTLKLVKYT